MEFYNYKKDDLNIIEFDATQCQQPEPMINSIYALKMLKDKNDRLIGRYFHTPFPLFQKIEEFFDIDAKELDNGDVEVVFKRK